MNLICQDSAIQDLQKLANSDIHSILIEGPEGCGKSHLARYYAKMVQVDDFQIVAPKVDSMKSAIEECYKLNCPIVLCIENLDIGVESASYVLLKFLEECPSNVYIIVTCRNIKHVPETIISRSAVVVTSPPVDKDISSYAIEKNLDLFQTVQRHKIWRCVRTFKDVDTVFNMNANQLEYFSSLHEVSKFQDSVSNLVWKISHYPDNSESPIELVIRYIMDEIGTSHVRKAGIDCIKDLSQGRIASHAVLAKFVFTCKYCE